MTVIRCDTHRRQHKAGVEAIAIHSMGVAIADTELHPIDALACRTTASIHQGKILLPR